MVIVFAELLARTRKLIALELEVIGTAFAGGEALCEGGGIVALSPCLFDETCIAVLEILLQIIRKA